MNKWNYNLETFYKENEISYYILGAFITDGCVSTYNNNRGNKLKNVISLTSKDLDWLKIVNQYICPDKPILNHGENCYRLQYNSTALGNWLISKGCVSRKSLTLEFPNIPEKYLIDFIRGCWDGDGSISFTKSGNGGTSYQRQANLTSGSLLFCQQLSVKLQTEGIKNKLYEHGSINREIDGRKINSNKCYRVVLSSGESAYKLCKLLYCKNKISMPRKQNIAFAIIDNWESR